MTHVAHLVRADARRFRVLLAVWVLLQLADTIFRAVRPMLAADVRLATAVELLGTVLYLTRWLGMIVVVALVVHSHALVGSDAFWMTRPIAWRELLASKLLLLGTAFVVVPCVCDVALMVASRVPVSDIPAVTVQTALFQCLWLFVCMAFAAVTRNLARLALVGGGVLVGLVLLLNVVIAMMLRNFPDAPQLTDVTARAVTSPVPAVVMLLMVIASAMTLVAIQYRTRSVRASVATGVIGIAITIFIAVIAPWPLRWLAPPDWAKQESAIQVVSDSPRGEFRPFEAGGPWNSVGAWRIGSLPLRAQAVEDGWLATVKLENGSVAFDDGTTLTTAGNGYSASLRRAPAEDPPLDGVVRRVLGVSRLLDHSPAPRAVSAPVIVIPQADFKKYEGVSGTYRGRFVVDLDRIETAATLPLQPGAAFQAHDQRVIIDRVVAQGGSVTVLLRLITSASMFDAETPPQMTFYLRNRAAAEAVAGSPHGMSGLSTGLAVPMVMGGWTHSEASGNGFQIASSLYRFPGAYTMDGVPVELSAEWISQAELVILQTISSGSVTRTIEVAGFQMIPAPPIQAGR